jgi:hypothetical protein
MLRRGEAARYDELMIARGIREYVSRDWRAVRDAKDAYWGERIARLGPIEAFRIAGELRRQALLQNPGWPRSDDRSVDLQFHARLAELLHRAGPARRR